MESFFEEGITNIVELQHDSKPDRGYSLGSCRLAIGYQGPIQLPNTRLQVSQDKMCVSHRSACVLVPCQHLDRVQIHTRHHKVADERMAHIVNPDGWESSSVQRGTEAFSYILPRRPISVVEYVTTPDMSRVSGEYFNERRIHRYHTKPLAL